MCCALYYEVLRDCLPEFYRGIKGSRPRLTFDLRRALSNLQMEPEKLELESTHTETLAIYICTHIKKVGVVFLIDDQHNRFVFTLLWQPHNEASSRYRIVECFLSVFFLPSSSYAP